MNSLDQGHRTAPEARTATPFSKRQTANLAITHLEPVEAPLECGVEWVLIRLLPLCSSFGN